MIKGNPLFEVRAKTNSTSVAAEQGLRNFKVLRAIMKDRKTQSEVMNTTLLRCSGLFQSMLGWKLFTDRSETRSPLQRDANSILSYISQYSCFPFYPFSQCKLIQMIMTCHP